jgi:hypothetical protein
MKFIQYIIEKEIWYDKYVGTDKIYIRNKKTYEISKKSKQRIKL